jgi:hypothetical protein
MLFVSTTENPKTPAKQAHFIARSREPNLSTTTNTPPNKIHLDSSFVRKRGEGFRKVVLGRHSAGLARLHGLTLQVDVGAIGLGLSLLRGVLLDTVDELGTAAGVVDVLDADVYTLLHVAVVDTLVDDDTDSGLGNVVDDTGLTMVDFVRHTLLDSAVYFDVDNVTNLVLLHVHAEGDEPLLLEVPREGISGTGSNTTAATHCGGWLVEKLGVTWG